MPLQARCRWTGTAITHYQLSAETYPQGTTRIAYEAVHASKDSLCEANYEWIATMIVTARLERETIPRSLPSARMLVRNSATAAAQPRIPVPLSKLSFTS